jgi:uncharacterized protein YdhG (YjbR/CyaY superfamily)
MSVKEVVFVANFESVESYLNSLSGKSLDYVETMRSLILSLNPNIQEYSAYGLLAYKLNGSTCYIGGFTNHVGIYGPISDVIKRSKEELQSYKVSKGTIQFPLSKPLDLILIEKIIKIALHL